ncbi:MAG: 1-acyl-sn-glycerol-3-phosphate acyltransferase [Acidobacteria bacterium]|nr:1-acyl-sn-glycerol-3-phosphate acyltransferase [Acidobacteriota bacterium]
MSETAKLSEGRDGREASESSALPQWAMELTRPVILFVSRALWKVRHKGVEHIPSNGGLIIAANHQTYIDPFWIGVAVKRTIRYLAWSEAFKWPALGRPMEWLGAWPIEVDKSDPGAYRRSLQWLREGGTVMIFPEGGRCNPDGSPMRFKPGAARMALEADVPVLPVTIRGGNTVWPKNQRLPRTGRVEIIFHPAHKLKTLPGEDTRKCARRETEQLAAVIASAL